MSEPTFLIKEFYKSCNTYGGVLHKPMVILRFQCEDEDVGKYTQEMTISEIVDKLRENQGYWVLMKKDIKHPLQNVPHITELMAAIIQEIPSSFIYALCSADVSTNEISKYCGRIELELTDITQEHIDKVAALHEQVDGTIVYLNTREEDEIKALTSLNYPEQLGDLYALGGEQTQKGSDVGYLAKAMDLYRIGYMLPNSRWSMTIRAHTVFRAGGYFTEKLKPLIVAMTTKDFKGKYNYKERESLI